jgi:hypothetical protein
MRNHPRAKRTRLIIGEVSEMVQTPIERNTSEERQEVIDWLLAHHYPVLPVAPAQSLWKYHKVAQGQPEQGVWTHCHLTADLQPIPLYTGKNPSYLDRTGLPHLLNHRQYQNRLPNKHELEAWFANPSNGVGTLGGWNNTVWLDFDVKQFPSQEECDAAVLKILEHPKLQETFIERSHSGGWRIGVRVKQKPNFTNFSLAPGGPHVGEALFEGRFTVLAPTLGPSGNLYQSIQRTIPVEVESLESIGIYSTKARSRRGEREKVKGEREEAPFAFNPSPCTEGASRVPIPGSIPLEMLGNDTSRDILHGNCPTGDRSEALTTATKEWYGWQNWGLENGIPISGDATTLAHDAGMGLGLDCDRINRILKTIDPASCQPAAFHRGGEESCWKKIYRLDRAMFEAKCPTYIKDAILEMFASAAPSPLKEHNSSPGHSSGNGNGSGGGRRGSQGNSSGGDDSDDNNRDWQRSRGVNCQSESFNTAALRSQIEDILIQDLPPSQLQAAKIRIRKAFPGVSEREIRELFETLEQELELSESRSDRRSEVDNLLKLGDQSLSLSEFLPADLAEPLTQLAGSLSIRPEVCLTLLLVAASSLHKTQTELVLHRGQSFSVPPTIFAGLVSESGQKKSPLLKALVKKPLSVLQREKRVAFQEALTQYEKDITGWDKCKSEERSSQFPSGKPKQPQQRLYYFTNATGEGLLYQFQAHPDKALLALVDELAGLFASQNKYSGGRGSDRQDILSAFDGTGATVLRASGTKADIDGLLLSICGTIQPEVLKRLMRDCSDPDGQWARFLFINQPLVAAKLSDDDGSSIDLTGRLLDYYRAIDQLPAREYRLSRKAFKRYQPVYNKLERLRVSHPNPGMRAVYSKMEGYIGRLALNIHVLHELAAGKTLPDAEIPLEHMESAIALAKFYIGQVKLIHASCAADLGEMAPHLAKVVELSKRMEATTGNSWIKAKVVQSGYDSRHRPRPDAIRSWFRELEALSLGATRGAGIRLEYSWKLPDFPIDDSDPPPQKKVEKVDKSGEKWITSPPTETTVNQGSSEKVEKVDTQTYLNELGLLTSDLGLKDTTQLVIEKKEVQTAFCSLLENSSVPATSGSDRLQQCALRDRPISSSSSPHPLSNESIDSEKSVQTCLPQDGKSAVGSSAPPELEEYFIPQTQNSLEITHSTSPQSGCDDGVEPAETVETLSTFSPPVDSVSTIADSEQSDEKAEVFGMKDELGISESDKKPFSPLSWATLRYALRAFGANANTQENSVESLETPQEGIVFNVSVENQPKAPFDSLPRDAEIEVRCTVVLNPTARQANLGDSSESRHALVTVEEFTTPPGLKDFSDESVQPYGHETSAAAPVTLAITPSGQREAIARSAAPEAIAQGAVPEAIATEGAKELESANLRTQRRYACRASASVGFPGSLSKIALPLLAVVTAVGIQGHRSFQVEWSLPSPNLPEAAESTATVESQVFQTGAEVDRTKVDSKRSFSVGDRVNWSNCPAHCEKFAPFEITSLDGDYAKLDLFSKPVPLAELSVCT